MIAPLLLSLLMIASAAAAVWMAKPVHAALCLAFSLATAGVIYVFLGAHFIGLVQLMVYVGAVAVLIVFSLLITRRRDETEEAARRPKALLTGMVFVLPLFGTLAWWVPSSTNLTRGIRDAELPLDDLGNSLFTTYAPAVLAVGVLLTAVMIGAALFARDPREDHRPPDR